jgi:hypothetical protein
MAPEQIARVEALKSRIHVEILVSDEVNRAALAQRVSELTTDFHQFPWQLLTFADLQQKVDEEYDRIGEL